MYDVDCKIQKAKEFVVVYVFLQWPNLDYQHWVVMGVPLSN